MEERECATPVVLAKRKIKLEGYIKETPLTLFDASATFKEQAQTSSVYPVQICWFTSKEVRHQITQVATILKPHIPQPHRKVYNTLADPELAESSGSHRTVKFIR